MNVKELLALFYSTISVTRLDQLINIQVCLINELHSLVDVFMYTLYCSHKGRENALGGPIKLACVHVYKFNTA